MTCNEYEIDVGEYVDGTLPQERAAAVDLHLQSCARCRAMAQDFQLLRSAAASLERKSPPPHVWTRLAASLEAAPAPEREPQGWRTGFAWRPAFSAAALAIVLAGGTWVAWWQAAAPGTPVVTRTPGGPAATAPPPPGMQLPSQVLTQQIEHLEAVVATDSAVLPDETKAVYRTTGGVLDEAIGETRAVLKSEPSNEFAQESLFEALRSKLALLQDMVALINEMRKGNQEGAARIVSGMEP